MTGSTREEHLQNLETVLQRLDQRGVRVKKSKCEFLKDSVEYLGHKIDASGLHATTKKVDAVINAPQPKNVKQLRSFLGLLQYYGRFIPNLSSLLHPLNSLLQKEVLSRKFWSAEISVRRTKITGKIGPPGPNFPGKIGPTLEIMVRV